MHASNVSALEHLQFTGNRLLMRGMKLALGILPLREPKLLVGTSALDELADSVMEVYINGAMEYDLVGEPLITETITSRGTGR